MDCPLRFGFSFFLSDLNENVIPSWLDLPLDPAQDPRSTNLKRGRFRQRYGSLPITLKPTSTGLQPRAPVCIRSSKGLGKKKFKETFNRRTSLHLKKRPATPPRSLRS